MAGSAICRRLAREGCEVLTAPRDVLDLRRQSDVGAWFAAHKPQAVFMAAGTVGGILANSSRPAEFLFDNLAIEANVIDGAYRAGVERLLFLGSSCIYPRDAAQPIRESALLTGPLEPTNEWYAVAKIAGLKMADAYRRQYGADFLSIMPTNLYGPGDNFDLSSAHVLPALIRKAHEAKTAGEATLSVWGTGAPRREFLYVDDLADAAIFAMRRFAGHGHLNIGIGRDIPIAELAAEIARIVGFTGTLAFDASKPDGTPRKLLDVSAMTALGWRASVSLADGLTRTYDWYRREGRAAHAIA
jgi:GDP-L-fucose synthase